MNKNIKSKKRRLEKTGWQYEVVGRRRRCGGLWVSDEHQGSLTIIVYTQSTLLQFSIFFLKCTPTQFTLAFVKRYIENIYSGVVLPMLQDVAPPPL